MYHNQTNVFSFQHVANMMIRMKREFPGSQNSIFPVFDTLLLLDRNVDLLTPLATQLTYEGLIDEIYGIQNSEYCTSRGLWSIEMIVHAFTVQPGWLPQRCTEGKGSSL